jgi:DNA-binding transcriptional MocR family regulator
MNLNAASLFSSRAATLQPSAIRELSKLAREPGMISFAGGTPDPALFPVESIAAAAADILANSGLQRECLQYGVSEGYLPLREAIAHYMSRKRIQASAADVLITCGSQQGLDFIGKLFVDPGDRILVTRPSYLGALQAFSLCEPCFVAIPQDTQGLDLVALERELAARPKFLYLVPDFANPTGLSLPLANRLAIIECARRYRVPIVEDQAYEALAYDDPPLPTLYELAQLDAQGGQSACVIYLGTFSKMLVPGLRIGWMLGPAAIHRALVPLKQAADLHSSVLDQMIIARVFERALDEHLAKLRSTYRARRDAMIAALEGCAVPGLDWSEPRGGMFVWLTFPETVDAAEILAHCIRNHRVLFVPGAPFHTDGTGRNTARLCFAAASPEVIREGVRRIAQAATEVLDAGPKAQTRVPAP